MWWRALSTRAFSLFCLPLNSAAEAKFTAAAGEIDTPDTQGESFHPPARGSFPVMHECLRMRPGVCLSERSQMLHQWLSLHRRSFP